MPATVSESWQVQVGGKLSAVTVAAGKCYVAAVDAHTVHALDAATGECVWTFTAGGRVDSPPTIDRGGVLFGSADGHVYCLRASDGQLAWRFQGAPVDRRTGDSGPTDPPAGTVLLRAGAEDETLTQLTRAFNTNLTALGLLALVVGMFLIYSTISFTIIQRWRSIAVLRALLPPPRYPLSSTATLVMP